MQSPVEWSFREGSNLVQTWAIILSAIALLLVIEGILPFLSPRLWREAMLKLIQRDDRRVRVMGLISLVVGALIMVFVHTGLIR